MSATLAVFNLNGPSFLIFYGVAFVLALAWSVIRRWRANEKFALKGVDLPTLHDAYEIAFLSGGAPRCSQLAVVRLLKSGAVNATKSRFFGVRKLVASGAAEPDFNDVERTLYQSVVSFGKNGMPLDQVTQLVGTKLSGIESKLAKLGLRPTTSETRGQAFLISLPLYGLLVLGALRALIGVSRDKPIGFLVFALIITFFVAFIVGMNKKKLTTTGEALLVKMREKYKSADNSDEGMFVGIALLGITAVPYDLTMMGLDEAFRNDLSRIGHVSSSGGDSGCSSGCSSGCGGGCGGCGGD